MLRMFVGVLFHSCTQAAFLPIRIHSPVPVDAADQWR
jgi:hypothetical protein